MNLYRRMPFYILITNESHSTIEVAKDQRVQKVGPQFSSVLHIEHDTYFLYSPKRIFFEPVNGVHCKPIPDRLYQMNERETV